MNSYRPFLLPAKYPLYTLISLFLASIGLAMLLKNQFIRPQKQYFSVPNNKSE